MPVQKPGRSVQIVGTPHDFLAPVEARFGPIEHDLAADMDNCVVRENPWGLESSYFGPGARHEDALAEGLQWPDMLCFLNPPYGNIAPWAKKAAEQSACGSTVLMLVPAAVGSNWFNQYVRPFAYVLELSPRVTFVGHTHPYPKDLILAVYTPERFIGREAWHWRMKMPANDNGIDPRQMAFPVAGVA